MADLQNRVWAGMSREYRAWSAAKTRCSNVKQRCYSYYGGRGIRMAPEWEHDYPAFLRDMGHCPPGYTLDRIDVDGHYAPGNCRWASRTEQANNCRSNRHLTHNGKTQTIAEWAREIGVHRDTLKRRIWLGWDTQRALTEPLRRWA